MYTKTISSALLFKEDTMKKKLYFGSNFKMYKNIHATEEYLQAITAATKDIDREKEIGRAHV